MLAKQHAERVFLLGDLPLEDRDRCRARIKCRLGSRGRELGVLSAQVAAREEVERVCERLGTLPGNLEFAVELEEGKVCGGDVAHKRQHDASPSLFAGQKVRTRGLR